MLTDHQMLDRLNAASLEETLCEDMRAEPDFAPEHHGNQCGCEQLDYPCFVCAHCMRLVTGCFGMGAGDDRGVLGVYLGECCDDCANALEGVA